MTVCSFFSRSPATTISKLNRHWPAPPPASKRSWSRLHEGHRSLRGVLKRWLRGCLVRSLCIAGCRDRQPGSGKLLQAGIHAQVFNAVDSWYGEALWETARTRARIVTSSEHQDGNAISKPSRLGSIKMGGPMPCRGHVCRQFQLGPGSPPLAARTGAG